MVSASLKIKSKYGLAYLKVRSGEKKLYKKEVFPKPRSEDESKQLKVAVSYKTRTRKPAAIEALAIGAENQGYWRKIFLPSLISRHATFPIELGKYQSGIAGVSSAEDDIADRVIQPYDLVKRDHLAVQDIVRLFGDHEWLSLFLKNKPPIPITPEEKGKKARPIDIYNYTKKFSEFYKNWLESIDEKICRLYLKRRRGVTRIEGESILKEVLLKKGHYEKVRKMNGEDLRGAYRDLSRQAIIGGTMAIMDNELTCEDKHDLEETNQASYDFFFEASGGFQITNDDLEKLPEDTAEKSSNIVIANILRKYDSLDEETVKTALKDNPGIITDVMKPIIKGSKKLGLKGIVNTLKRLKELDFVFKDAVLATRWMAEGGKLNERNLEHHYGVELNYEWLDLLKDEFQEKLGMGLRI